MTRPTIVWFRQDLRLTDNPALSAAHAAGRPVIAVYVKPAPGTDGRPLGAAASWWLHHSIASLSARLDALGVPLVLASGDPRAVLPRLVRETDAEAVHWNRRYEASAIAVDREIKHALAEAGIAVTSHNSHLINEPWQVTTAGGTPYRVFTPYWKAARAKGEPPRPLPAPTAFPALATSPAGENLDDWRLTPRNPDWAAAFPDRWHPGEPAALARLDQFLDRDLDTYTATRDRPDLSTTSGLSPHLRFGEISPRLVWHATRARVDAGGISEAAGDKFLSEVAWREFSYHLLYHHPDLATKAFQSKFDRFPWAPPEATLSAWQRGRTGYPLVDAGMRELWTTGWMHNRVRMVAASFLAKHLRLDWRLGEAWFWDTLVDADPASNAASWQWVAGSGADAAPFFRIFNPVLQGEKFDPDGAYVRRWVPELAALPAKWIHKPWQAPAGTLLAAGVELGADYPRPIVDHAAARVAALDAFRSLGATRPELEKAI